MMLALFYAIPAAVLALLVYFQMRPPDVSPRGMVLLRWALVLGVCAWLPVLAVALIPAGWLLPRAWRNVAGASGIISNAMNMLAILMGLRIRSTQSLFSAALLGLNQLALILSAFAAQIP